MKFYWFMQLVRLLGKINLKRQVV